MLENKVKITRFWIKIEIFYLSINLLKLHVEKVRKLTDDKNKSEVKMMKC